jgi:hypothetical protein
MSLLYQLCYNIYMYSLFNRNPKEIRHYWTDEIIQPKKRKLSIASNGFVLYDGPSLYDNAPIVVIATGFKKPSINPKTKDMIQIAIMRSDIHPQNAIRSGEDKSVCGLCKHRGIVKRVSDIQLSHHRTEETRLSSNRSCYVDIRHIISMWRKYKGLTKGGTYPKVTRDEIANLFKKANYPPRFGDYGDPAMVPLWVWKEVARGAREGGWKWTGYTSQWRLKRVQPYKPYLQASVNTYDEQEQAREMGWKTYRVGRKHEPKLPGEIYCPETYEGGEVSHCNTCTLCMGTSGTGPNILTRPTGEGKKMQYHEEREYYRRFNPYYTRRRNPYSYTPYYRNPSDETKAMKTINGILGDLTPCDKKAWGLRRARRRRMQRFYSRRNPYYNLYRHNPGEDKAMKTINGILEDLTPCDKKDWGLARYRNRRQNRRHFRNRSRFRYNPIDTWRERPRRFRNRLYY